MSFMLSLHIMSLLIWSAALLYFPLLFVGDGLDRNSTEKERALTMQGALYTFVMTPSALMTVAAGTWLIFERGFSGGWLPVKLSLVLLMVFFHIYCGGLMASVKRGRLPHRPWFFGGMPAIPAILVIAVIFLVTGKPF